MINRDEIGDVDNGAVDIVRPTGELCNHLLLSLSEKRILLSEQKLDIDSARG